MWSTPKEEYRVNDLDKFFSGCVNCRMENVHVCEEDNFTQEIINYHSKYINNIFNKEVYVIDPFIFF